MWMEWFFWLDILIESHHYFDYQRFSETDTEWSSSCSSCLCRSCELNMICDLMTRKDDWFQPIGYGRLVIDVCVISMASLNLFFALHLCPHFYRITWFPSVSQNFVWCFRISFSLSFWWSREVEPSCIESKRIERGGRRKGRWDHKTTFRPLYIRSLLRREERRQGRR